MRNLFLGTLLAIFANACIADSPAREPYDYKVCSGLKTYCADVGASSGIKLYNMLDPKQHPILVTEKWYPQIYISNDGRKILSILTTIVPELNYNQPVVEIFLDGNIVKRLHAADLIDKKDMVKTSSGYSWGYPVGFSDDEKTFTFRSLSNKDFKMVINQN